MLSEHLHASEKKVSHPVGTPSVTACFGFGAVVQTCGLPSNKCTSLPQDCGLPASQSFLALYVCVVCIKGSKGLRLSESYHCQHCHVIYKRTIGPSFIGKGGQDSTPLSTLTGAQGLRGFTCEVGPSDSCRHRCSAVACVIGGSGVLANFLRLAWEDE